MFGPNVFLRVFQGTVVAGARGNLDVEARYEGEEPAIALEITNLARQACTVSISSGYGGETITHDLRAGQSFHERFELGRSFGWYDLTIVTDTDPGFLRRLAGHLENGRDSVSDPALGS